MTLVCMNIRKSRVRTTKTKCIFLCNFRISYLTILRVEFDFDVYCSRHIVTRRPKSRKVKSD
jgi:hypothetical protein